MMKRLLSAALALTMAFSLGTGLAERDLQAEFEEEMNLGRYITSRGAAYELEGLMDYQHYWYQVGWTFDKTGQPIEAANEGLINEDNGEVMASSAEEIVDTLRAKREALVQTVDDVESVCWYIWGENMAQAEDAGSYDYSHTFDEAGFKPFLVPYMLEDQSAVKGNVIVIAGGGFSQRCHDYEGDASAAVLNDLGYNAFILQRRVAPSEKVDAALDLQRAVRYLKFYAEDKKIGAIENLAAVGFSGGGSTISLQLSTCYGDITPDAVYPAYVCDELDAVNADYAVAGIFYGASADYVTDNPNMPDCFFAVGAKDQMALANTLSMFTVANEQGWDPGLYVAADAPHGFALTGVRAATDEGTTMAQEAVNLFDLYMQVHFGLVDAHF